MYGVRPTAQQVGSAAVWASGPVGIAFDGWLARMGAWRLFERGSPWQAGAPGRFSTAPGSSA